MSIKAESFDYAVTISQVLKKLAKHFPSESFKVSVDCWAFNDTKHTEEVYYRIWSDKDRREYFSVVSLEVVYNQFIEARNVEF